MRPRPLSLPMPRVPPAERLGFVPLPVEAARIVISEACYYPVVRFRIAQRHS